MAKRQALNVSEPTVTASLRAQARRLRRRSDAPLNVSESSSGVDEGASGAQEDPAARTWTRESVLALAETVFSSVERSARDLDQFVASSDIAFAEMKAIGDRIHRRQRKTQAILDELVSGGAIDERA